MRDFPHPPAFLIPAKEAITSPFLAGVYPKAVCLLSMLQGWTHATPASKKKKASSLVVVDAYNLRKYGSIG
jgi:hypothetical protein